MRIAIFVLILLLHGCAEQGQPSPEVVAPETPMQRDTTPRVTGIGGIFIKAGKPKELKAWYGEHLGLKLDAYGSAFEFRNANDSTEINYLRWGIFPESTEYFQPSNKAFMINYRVHRLEALLERLQKQGVTVLDTIATYPYGKFVHILDPDGNKIELWEPVDSVFTNMGGPTTK